MQKRRQQQQLLEQQVNVLVAAVHSVVLMKHSMITMTDDLMINVDHLDRLSMMMVILDDSLLKKLVDSVVDHYCLAVNVVMIVDSLLTVN